MSRPAVPKRKSAKSEARQVMEADIMPIIGPALKDFSRGAKDLMSQGKTAYGVVKSGAQKVKDFLNK